MTICWRIKTTAFFQELVEHHVSGQLKVAPEHCSAAVLDKMGKPHIEAYLRFAKRYFDYTKQIGKEQYLVPYLMSSHPGSTLKDAVELAQFLKREKLRPEQVQDFYPTPGTISTCMFYTGLDPYTMETVYVARTPKEKALQRALLQYFKPQNHALVEEALRRAGRPDLIGNGANCLIRPQAGVGKPGGSKKRFAESSKGEKAEWPNEERAKGREKSAPPLRYLAQSLCWSVGLLPWRLSSTCRFPCLPGRRFSAARS